MRELGAIKRTLDRERAARKQAEDLLEKKSLELYHSNQALERGKQELQSQNARMATILQTAADAIISFDQDGQISSLNEAALRIFDLPDDSDPPRVGALIQGFNVNEECLGDQDSGFDNQRATVDNLTGPFIGESTRGAKVPLEVTTSRIELSDEPMFVSIVRDDTERKSLEAKLAHAQKLESIGQLAAGVAHEINTPIQFVRDNTQFLHDAFVDLDQLLDQYLVLQNLVSNHESIRPIAEQIDKFKEDTDFEFLREEIPLAIDQALAGSERVTKIVRAMKDFSHPGSVEMKRSNINRAIESTVVVSSAEWKTIADLETELDDQLPDVFCFVDELNQVILNMIVNASHAIQARYQDGQKGLIRISTKRSKEMIELTISDDGSGIPDEAIHKIFDPFFTTKEVGKGTGQGLALAYNVIVDMHGGEIQVDSEMGKGTTFLVKLPVGGPQEIQVNPLPNSTNPGQVNGAN